MRANAIIPATQPLPPYPRSRHAVDGVHVTDTESWLLYDADVIVAECLVPYDPRHVKASQLDLRAAWTQEKLDDVHELARLGADGCGRVGAAGRRCIVDPTKSEETFRELRALRGVGKEALFALQDALAKGSGSMVHANHQRHKRNGHADATGQILRFLAGDDAALPRPPSPPSSEAEPMAVDGAPPPELVCRSRCQTTTPPLYHARNCTLLLWEWWTLFFLAVPVATTRTRRGHRRATSFRPTALWASSAAVFTRWTSG